MGQKSRQGSRYTFRVQFLLPVLTGYFVLDRTKNRPLARGDITPKQAVIFLGAQLTAGLGVLLQLNWHRCEPPNFTIYITIECLSNLPIYVQHSAWCIVTVCCDNISFHEALDTLATSCTGYLPCQLLQRNPDLTPWQGLHSTGALFWVGRPWLGQLTGKYVFHFTPEEYAGLWSTTAYMLIRSAFLAFKYSLHPNLIGRPQDKLDDVKIGIRSTALLFGDSSRSVLTAMSASSLSLISYAGYINSQGEAFYLGAGLAALQLSRVLYRTDFDSRSSCWKGFVGCGWAGFWIWMGALGDYVLLLSSPS